MSVSVEIVKGSFADFKRAGQEEPTNSWCGNFKRFTGCILPHDFVTLEEINYKDMVYIHPTYMSCDKPSCRIDYKRGFARKEAQKCEERFNAIQGSLMPDHFSVSLGEKDWGVSVLLMAKKAMAAAEVRGLTGGCWVYHQERFKPSRGGWYFAPHFHFVANGEYVGKCRACKKFDFACEAVCGDCDGFEARTRREYYKDGFVVKIAEQEDTGKKGVRKSIFHTMYYQLDHSSYQISAKRHNIVRWFGSHSYRKAKVKVVKKYAGCPLCSSRLKPLDYLGDDPRILGLMRRRTMGEDRDTLTHLHENGVVVWKERVEEVPAYMLKYLGRESEDFVRYGDLD